jgi:hypothetical protein
VQALAVIRIAVSVTRRSGRGIRPAVQPGQPAHDHNKDGQDRAVPHQEVSTV